MKTLGYIGAFLGGAIAGTALGLIFAPEKGEDTRSKIAGAVDDFCKKHDIKLSRKDVDDLVDVIRRSRCRRPSRRRRTSTWSSWTYPCGA